MLRRLTVVLLLLAVATLAWARTGFPLWQGAAEREFLPAEQVFVPGPVRLDGDTWVLEGRIAEAHYLYRHALRLIDATGADVALQSPAGTPHHDEFFGDTEIYTGVLPIAFPGDAPGPLQLRWQGCAEAGICYPPQTLPITLPADATAPVAPVSTTASPSAQAGHTPSPDAAHDAQAAAPLPTASEDDRAPAPAPPLASDAAHAGATSAPGTSPAITPPTGTPTASATPPLGEDQATAQRLAALGPIAGTLLFFGFGLLLAFTPCTLPMLPILSGLIVGGGAGPRRALALSAAYILAMATAYAAVGIAAGLAGANLQATLQAPWLLGLFAALFVVLAASLFGLFELRMPSALTNRLARAGETRRGGSLLGAASLGLLSALLVGPCMTAPLAGALLYIGQTGSAVTGGLALFALGLGMGLPLALIAVFGARVLPRPGRWMDRVKSVFGFVMLGLAITMLARVLPATATLALWGAWLLALAVSLFAWSSAALPPAPRHWMLRFGSLFAGLWATLMLVGAASGGDAPMRPLAHLAGGPALAATTPAKPAYVDAKSIADVDARIAEAAQAGRWTLIDVYADWCVSCHVIERDVFGHPEVATRLASMQVLRPDVTAHDAVDQALLRHWGVLGPPTLILVGPDGRERRAQRTVGEIDARGFIARLDAAGAP